MQIRNTGNTDRDNDFLLSPVADENGKHFDSREYLTKILKETEPNSIEKPVSGDANGAYNIARKGIIMAEHLKTQIEKPSLYISDAEWDLWLNHKKDWTTSLHNFTKNKMKK